LATRASAGRCRRIGQQECVYEILMFTHRTGWRGTGKTTLKILFAALHYGYFRNLESVVDELARRGHDIHLTAERPDSALAGRSIVDAGWRPATRP
jgi:hypothetical protein